MAYRVESYRNGMGSKDGIIFICSVYPPILITFNGQEYAVMPHNGKWWIGNKVDCIRL